MAVPGSPVIIDLSHHNPVSDWERVREAGILAIIHKATEGATWRDKRYRERRQTAKAAGLLWGAYHFTSGVDPIAQLDNFLDHADPAPDELVALDYEDSFSGANMTLDGMVTFVEGVHARLGRWPVIYGGHLLREVLKDGPHPVLARCPLWYARYNAEPIGIPDTWKSWTLWQYSDGNHGPDPQPVDGIGACDRNTFNGTVDALKAMWPLG